MDFRRPLGLVCTIGMLGWPVGVFIFGGPDDAVGGPVIGMGCMLVLVAMATESGLRDRKKHSTRR